MTFGNKIIDLQSIQGAIEALARERIEDRISDAKAKNIPIMNNFEIYAIDRLRTQNHVCALTGWRFDVAFETTGAGRRHFAPSPDRIDPNRGYVRGNVQWVLWCLNRGKGTLEETDFIRVCAAVADHARARGLIAGA